MTTKTKIVVLKPFYRGDTRKYRFTLLSKTTGLPLSVDGGRIFCTFKSDKSLTDENAEIYKSAATIEADPQNPTGIMDITLDAADTEVTPGNYYFDFQFVGASGEVTTLIPLKDEDNNHKDKVRIFEDVTRRITVI